MNQEHLQKLQTLLLQIPKGKVTTYKKIARAIETKGYRYIGQLLHQNPEPDRYPCYRVVRSDGRVGGFAKGPMEKIRRLERDGIKIKKGKIANFAFKLHRS